MLIDAHIHIQDIGSDVLETLRTSDDLILLSPSVTVENFNKLDQIDLQAIKCVKFIGLHPWYLSDLDGELDHLESALKKNKHCGVGEIGLDKAAKNIDFEVQKKYFIKQLDLAYKHKRPVLIHCVRAWGTLFDILDKHPIDKSTCMLHAFNASMDMLDRFIKLGSFFSLNIKHSLEDENVFVERIRKIPIDRLFLETDYPYMLKCNDYVNTFKNYYKRCSDYLGLEQKDFENQLNKNLLSFTKKIYQ